MEDRVELQKIRAFTRKSEIDKAISTLNGILIGISLDSHINDSEIKELDSWCLRHQQYIDEEPFRDLIHMVRSSIEDGIVTTEEYNDIAWFTKMVHGHSLFYDVVTKDLQYLQGIVHGILADNRIGADEVRNLQKWMFGNEHLIGNYPYDEILGIVTSVLKDGSIDPDEENLLKVFFGEFVSPTESTGINFGELEELKKTIHVSGICTLAPEIKISGSVFCFTGLSKRAKRSEIARIISEKGGLFNNHLVQDTRYLIYGADGNPVWAYSCFGRKVEQAMEMRKHGSPLLIVNEVDFWDALA